MLTLIRRARRRLLYNELLSEGVTATSAALAALIVLLILGTEVLNWYWVLLLPGTAVALAWYRVGRRVPELYVSAQTVDRRMNLADVLSTALYFSERAGPAADSELRRLQRQQAETAAATVDLRRAVPYRIPRSAYAAGVLVLVASSLFALRYGLTRRLDLNEPMARILQDALGLEGSRSAGTAPRKDLNSPEGRPRDGDGPLASDPPSIDPNQQAGDPLDDDNKPASSAEAKKDAANGKDDGSQDASEGGDPGQGDPRASGEQNASNRSNAEKSGENSRPGAQQGNGSSNSSGLLSKMKEAMQNLLSSMKQQPSGSNSQSSPQSNQAAQNGKQKGQQKAGKPAQEGEKQSGEAGGEQADPDLSSESQQADNAPGKGDDAKPSNKQPGGGIGSRDGSKDVKEAEQLAAMGKITQIIGKRSAALSGEATVEVQSTVQQLRTAYSDRSAQHADAGSEIGRDEIPAALESYVQQYFEQVRKEPAGSKK